MRLGLSDILWNDVASAILKNMNMHGATLMNPLEMCTHDVFDFTTKICFFVCVADQCSESGNLQSPICSNLNFQEL